MKKLAPGRSNKLSAAAASTTGLPALLSIAQVAEATGMCDKTIRRRINDGTLTAHRIGPRLIRIERDAVFEMLAGLWGPRDGQPADRAAARKS